MSRWKVSSFFDKSRVEISAALTIADCYAGSAGLHEGFVGESTDCWISSAAAAAFWLSPLHTLPARPQRRGGIIQRQFGALSQIGFGQGRLQVRPQAPRPTRNPK